MHDLIRQFDRIGARACAVPPRWGFTLDVRPDGGSERFEIARPDDFTVRVVAADRPRRHLLLLAEGRGDRHRFVCGHDERHWFVAAVPGAPGTVGAALEALKPAGVRAAQERARVPTRRRQRRRNRAFVRQGEWFFVPAPDLDPDPWLVLRREPLTRDARSKPHICEELFRDGGEPVHVHPGHAPSGITPDEFARLPRKVRRTRGWTHMRRNPRAYARGRVRHADHKTIRLDGWHEILMNTENQTQARRHVAFLD